jgi:hypothetical protein
MRETSIIIRLLLMYFPRNWKFGSDLSKPWKWGGGGLETSTPLGTPLLIERTKLVNGRTIVTILLRNLEEQRPWENMVKELRERIRETDRQREARIA